MTTACAPTTHQALRGRHPNLERRYKETESAWVREEIEPLHDRHALPACGGYRLKPEALAVKIAGLHIGEVTRLSIRAAAWFDASCRRS
jgi:excinuclease ABC subunit A